MRLINTHTGVFEEFIGRNIPQYAILSHTWEEDEVSFAAMASESRHGIKGYQKIAMTCRMAAEQGHGYAWVDTCCIDKSSSAELSEAINSMFRWYQRSQVCYVYLSDLDSSVSLDIGFARCRWFTRGWTLQELIAPQNIVFFDREWNRRGSKTSLLDTISQITGIKAAVLLGQQPLSSIAVAQRLSWAARRNTTRIEDEAYCLLGIFDVNMPLLYGEEEKAFRRLQEEIVKSHTDFSIFAWTIPDKTSRPQDPNRVFCGVLANTPRYFANCGTITNLASNDALELTFTNVGIKTASLLRRRYNYEKGTYCWHWPLACSYDGDAELGIKIRKCGADQFVREDPWSLSSFKWDIFLPGPQTLEPIYLRTDPVIRPGDDVQLLEMRDLIVRTRLHALQLQFPAAMSLSRRWPKARFDDEDQIFFVTATGDGDAAIAKFAMIHKGRTGEKFAVFQSMFLATGWSQLDPSRLHCTIIDYKKYSEACKTIESDVSNRVHNRQHLLMKARVHSLPKTSAVHFEVPGTDQVAVISFVATIVEDATLCMSKFWRIQFSREVYSEKHLPKIENGEWSIR